MLRDVVKFHSEERLVEAIEMETSCGTDDDGAEELARTLT